MKTLIALATPLLLLPFFAAAQAPRATIARAVEAMGGEQALRGLAVTVEEYNAAAFGLGQEETPLSQARATFSSGRIVTDLRATRRAQWQEARPVAGGVTRIRRILNDGIGMLETNGVPNVDGGTAGVATGIRQRPERLLLAALDQPAALRALPPRRWRGEMLDGVWYGAGPDTVSLYFDRPTGLLTVSEVVTEDGVLGDRRTATWFTRWMRGSQVKLPRQIDVEANGRLQQHTVVTSVMENPAGADSFFVIPDSIVRRARATPPAASTAPRLADIAPGVWRAEGANHFSLVVEQTNGLIVIEAPLSSVRSRAVLDTLSARFPTKPVRTLVNSHHHWDHSGGVREYMARGIPVVTHARNAEFFRGIAAARKTVAPDALSRRPRAPVITTFSDSLALGQGAGRVVLYTLPSTHAEGILAAYLPAHRVLYVVDVVSPTATLPALGSREVVELVRRRGLAVDRLVGGHSGIAPWADIERAAGR